MEDFITIIGIIVVVILIIMQYRKDSEKIKDNKNVNNMQKVNIRRFLQQNNFFVAKEIIIDELDTKEGFNALYFDDKNKKFAIKSNKHNKPIIYNYQDLIEFEVVEDNKTIIQGRVGSAIIGSLTFGTAGAVVGGARSRGISKKLEKLQLRIRVNDFNNPEHVLTVINKNIKSRKILVEKDNIANNDIIIHENKKYALINNHTMILENIKICASYLTYVKNDIEMQQSLNKEV